MKPNTYREQKHMGLVCNKIVSTKDNLSAFRSLYQHCLKTVPSYQPHDHLSLALCLLTPLPQSLILGRLLMGSIRDSTYHISPEYQSLNFNARRDIKNTHKWYFRSLCLEHRGGGWGDGGSQYEAELGLRTAVWKAQCGTQRGFKWNCWTLFVPNVMYTFHLSVVFLDSL